MTPSQFDECDFEDRLEMMAHLLAANQVSTVLKVESDENTKEIEKNKKR